MIGLRQVYAIQVGKNPHINEGFYFVIASCDYTAKSRFHIFMEENLHKEFPIEELNILQVREHIKNVITSLP